MLDWEDCIYAIQGTIESEAKKAVAGDVVAYGKLERFIEDKFPGEDIEETIVNWSYGFNIALFITFDEMYEYFKDEEII